MTTSSAGGDASNGWEAVAPAFIREGRHSRTGVAVVADWVMQLPPRCTLLDLGCGPGVPRSEPLHARGQVFAVDASASLAHAYQERFPTADVACEAAEESTLFARQFDGVLAWGLLFLLTHEQQLEVIRRVGRALTPGGRFLFTAPWQVATWIDHSTGRPSESLGRSAYQDALGHVGLTVVREHEDEGGNHYFDARKSALACDAELDAASLALHQTVTDAMMGRRR